MSWLTYGGYTLTGTCLPCCEEGCFLTMPTLLIDSTTIPYADMATAAAAIADQTGTGCYVEGRPQGSDTRTTFTSSFTSGTLAVTSAYTTSGPPIDSVLMRLYLTVADGLSVVYTLSTTGGFGPICSLQLYQDDQSTLVDQVSISSHTASGTFAPTIPADGYYWLKVGVSDLAMGGATSIDLSITGGSSLQPCTARAAYGATPDYVICA